MSDSTKVFSFDLQRFDGEKLYVVTATRELRYDGSMPETGATEIKNGALTAGTYIVNSNITLTNSINLTTSGNVTLTNNSGAKLAAIA